jgi:ribosomal protein L20
MAPGPTNKGNFSLPHNPLTPLDKDTPPTAWTIDILKHELYENVQSVQSHLGGGNHGHLGMLMPKAEYILISNEGEPYVYPDKPDVPNYHGTAARMSRQKEDYKEAQAVFMEARNLQAHIRKLMAKAIPNVYIGRLRNPAVRYSNVNPKDMLNQLKSTYGTIKPKYLVANMERISKPWNLDTAIEHVFTNGDDC